MSIGDSKISTEAACRCVEKAVARISHPVHQGLYKSFVDGVRHGMKWSYYLESRRSYPDQLVANSVSLLAYGWLDLALMQAATALAASTGTGEPGTPEFSQRYEDAQLWFREIIREADNDTT